MRKLMIIAAMLLTAASAVAAEKSTILFICPYGGAKSVIAASYFNRLAEEQNLAFVGVAVAAEEAYEEVPPKVADFLSGEGFDVKSFKPRKVEAGDLDRATKVISIDCDLKKLDARGASVEEWSDVPKVSVDLPGSAAAIKKHVANLAAGLKNGR